MKTISKILLLFITLGLTAACSDFLDNEPQSEFTGDPQTSSNLESQYASVSDAQAGLNGAYEKFKMDIFQFENFSYGDIQSDNAYAGGDGVPGEEVDGIRVSSMNSKNRLMWAQYYEMGGAATNVIENTRLMKSGIDEGERKRIIAEAKFIRAWAYFDIVRIWGAAPLMIELIPPITAENLEEMYPKLYPERTPVEAIYDQIIKDLEEAIPALESKSKGDFKATKGAANGLLAKVYATRGDKATRNYKKVVELCDLVIGDGYSLLPDYDQLWNPANKFTSESIFEVYYNATSPNWAFWVLFSEEDGSITWRCYCTPTHDLISKFNQDDARFASSIVFKTVPYDTYFPSTHYPIANKIRQKDAQIILMRLADIMLLKAEALVELNRPGEAMTIVNIIRSRAGIDALSVSLSQNQARLAVEQERQLELAFEGHRWFDLLRNGRMIEVMQLHKDKNGKLFFPKIDEFRILWPIPQTEKDANPNLTQNPGY
ncbi:MAG: RagB/SusD family nutrient uptake outer membrane protein [Petrimonas sp.]|nr:RagB/SusD family nutrient uptake outer membrane protein [Petrimonas sp.]MEA4979734.1 RagB/SusD family nutrient uptake outer membrane protein [Petrimonas sp.]